MLDLIVKHVPNALTHPVGRQILKTQKASPTILFVGGVVGIVATAVLASKATLKLDQTLEKTEENIEIAKHLRADKNDEVYSESDYQKDMAIIYSRAAVDVVKLYMPAITVGVVSIAALTGSHVMLTKRNTALAAAYTALDRGFREYRKKVVDELGEDADQRFRYSNMPVVPDSKSTDVATTESAPKDPNIYSVYARFFDELCSSWSREPEYNLVFLRCQQNYANDLLLSRGHVFLNEVYDMLGLERSRAGSVVGWIVSKEGDNYVDFGIFNGDRPRARDFVNGREGAILLDFNVDGVIYDKI